MVPAHILISDDDELLSRFYTRLLRNAGYAAEAVPDGSLPATVERCRHLPPDLLITDLAKPGDSGLVLCRTLRSDPAFCRIALLVISGFSESAIGDQGLALAAGADHALPKPVNNERLLATVRDMVETRAMGLQLDRTSGLMPWPVLEARLRWFSAAFPWALLVLTRRRLSHIALLTVLHASLAAMQLELRVSVAQAADPASILLLGAPADIAQLARLLHAHFGTRLHYLQVAGPAQRVESLAEALQLVLGDDRCLGASVSLVTCHL
ncbi:response regulator [Candidatus Gracilibacteria bacterium]|nr:response regulator [Candidatus Gracilibacteria bacterium]